LHALVRFDGLDPDASDAILPPPAVRAPDGSLVPVLSAERLAQLVAQAAAEVAVHTAPHPDRPEGWRIAWGAQVDVRTVHRGLDGAELTETHVAGYLAKYATKGSEAAGLTACRITPATLHAYRDIGTHVGRLVDASWRLGRRLPGGTFRDETSRPYGRLRRWAHLFGYGGHFSTKSRRYSCTLTSLRKARIRAARAIAQGLSPDQLAELDEQQATTVIGQWRYTGTGWLTTGDAALAAMAADAARKRRPAGTARPHERVAAL